MKTIRISIILFLATLVINSCDLVDPTEVVNPNVTEGTIIGTPNSTSLWLVGLDRQLALTYNEILVIAALASDNYVNTQTFFNQTFDILDIRFNDADVNALALDISDLRNSADVGINAIHPGDSESTDAQLAELHFFRGWAFLLGGEIFKTLPAVGGEAALPAATHLANAIADFQAAEALDATNAGYKLALARAYYFTGDKANAVIKANEAIAADAAYLRNVEWDAVNGAASDSDLQDALQDRGNFDDLQPLPSLDFLDPKAYAVSSTLEAPIPILKIEEAHLILAEAEISDADLPGANQKMKDVIALVGTRATATFDDSVEGRTNDATTSTFNRPDVTTVTVGYAGEAQRAGLVLNRLAGDITIPVISGTSLVDADIDALVTEDDYLEALYLMRQEIFIAEGRRWMDLGIKLPVSEVEQLSNTNITASDIEAAVPAFLPTDMDAITYDAGAGTCVITHNVNAILAANKTNAAVLPFH
ncbi:MAG: hypothetical protein ABJG47_01680 [Ekhidna sp.]